MENQHRKIQGYRELNQAEIDAMNHIKEFGEKLGDLVQGLENLEETDKTFVAQAKSHLQIGIMLAVRAVAKPTTF
jgi:anion-transporting  ArsA/GET3 family ATPase